MQTLTRLLLLAALFAAPARGEDSWRSLFASAKPFPGNTLPATLEGKVVVVNVWATWCQPCIAEFPHLNGLVEKYGNEVVFLAVTAEEAGTIEKLLASKPFRYVQLTVGGQAIAKLVERARAAGFEAQGNVRPLHGVIGKDGAVRYFYSGFSSAIDRVLMAEIDRALGRETKKVVRDTTVTPEAAAVLDRYLAALGGAERLRAITTMRRVETQSFSGKSSRVTTERDYRAGKVVARVEVAPGFTMLTGFDGQRAWRVGMGDDGYQEEDTAGLATRQARRSPNPFLEYRSAGRGFRRGPDATVDGAHRIILLSDSEAEPGVWVPLALHFDPETYLLIREVEGEGAGASVTDYGDYKTVSGIEVPHRVKTAEAGMEILLVVEEVAFDVTLDPATFELPKK